MSTPARAYAVRWAESALRDLRRLMARDGARIIDNALLIVVAKIGHRREVCRRR